MIVTATLILLAGWFGFELGRKWEIGKAEDLAEIRTEESAERRSRGGIKLNAIRIRR